MNTIRIRQKHPLAQVFQKPEDFPLAHKKWGSDGIIPIYPLVDVSMLLITLCAIGLALFMLNVVSWKMGVLLFVVIFILLYYQSSNLPVIDKRTALITSLKSSENQWEVFNPVWKTLAAAFEKENADTVGQMFKRAYWLERAGNILNAPFSETIKVDALKSLLADFTKNLDAERNQEYLNALVDEIWKIVPQEAVELRETFGRLADFIKKDAQINKMVRVSGELKEILFSQAQEYDETVMLAKIKRILQGLEKFYQDSLGDED